MRKLVRITILIKMKSIRSFSGQNESSITFWNKNWCFWFPKMQGQCYATNPNPNFILGPKQTESNHLNPNERFSCQNKWEWCFFFFSNKILPNERLMVKTKSIKNSFRVQNKPRVLIWTQMRDFDDKTCEDKVLFQT